MSEKIMLVDGNSIINRAFFGMPDLRDPSGRHTGAVYGFLSILFRFLDEEEPEYLAVAFDVHAPTFRHGIFPEYKAGRRPMPEELKSQVPLLKQVLDSMGICRLEKAGLEADDILGTLAKGSESLGMDAVIISGDRDLLQVATDRIMVRIPKTKAGKTEVFSYHSKDVEDEYGVSGQGFIDLKGLMGDQSDNIPGVPRVGEKTAIELMRRFGSLSNVYERLEEVSKKAIKESLRENKDLACLSRDLAEINCHSDIHYDYEEMRLGNIYTPEAYGMFREMSFRNFYPRFENVSAVSVSSRSVPEKKEITDEAGFEETFKAFENACVSGGLPGFAIEGEDRVIGSLTLSYKGSDGYETREIKAGSVFSPERIRERLSLLFENREAMASTWNIKDQYGFLGTDVSPDRFFDVQVASYLLDPLRNDYDPGYIAQAFMGITADSPGISYVSAGSAGRIQELLKENKEDRLFFDIEMPLTKVLHDMESWGIRLQPMELTSYGESLAGRISELEKAIYEGAGEEFNINSPKQLGVILFEKQGLQGGKKTKTGWSTSADVLEKLSSESQLVRDVLEYRTYAKLKSTYADSLSKFIGKDGRVHTRFSQTTTATGRLSSYDPNLQNIPMRTELGRRIRKVFVPDSGFIFTDADYSQIELRVLASMAGDERLIEAYREGRDIHAVTASRVFHVPLDEVTPLMRRNAKAVNFGIVYGISSFGLSNDLSISRKEAEEYISSYFETYPGIRRFMDTAVAEAKEKGYVTTAFGRRRPVPELKSPQFMQRSFGERVARNAPIQGTAADIIKIAMIGVWNRIRREGLKSRLILQIHDELLIETAEDEEERIAAILREEMEGACELKVPLIIDMHTGRDWYEAK